ncbi:MAG: hypothetical protein IC227_04095 [Enterococcus lacertideformus]|uniref:Uncharacterized protein n=1 Tax=Enterococcus lacertideformus TaxID=2771493 RepID=A0A931AV70_9ENTE|nr:hypothetical protein [Enterococcus lacertideformus]
MEKSKQDTSKDKEKHLNAILAELQEAKKHMGELNIVEEKITTEVKRQFKDLKHMGMKECEKLRNEAKQLYREMNNINKEGPSL